MCILRPTLALQTRTLCKGSWSNLYVIVSCTVWRLMWWVLCSLGDIFSALTAKKDHIPYGHSKLTQLLADSLGMYTQWLRLNCHIYYKVTHSLDNFCCYILLWLIWACIFMLAAHSWLELYVDLIKILHSVQPNVCNWILIFIPFAGGDSKALLIVNISPSIADAQETIASLNFGTRARNVELSLGNRDTIKKWRDMVCFCCFGPLHKKSFSTLDIHVFLLLTLWFLKMSDRWYWRIWVQSF